MVPFKEFLIKLCGVLPQFGRQFFALLLGSRAAFLEWDLASDAALELAFTFLAVSFGIAFIAQIPMLAEKQNKEVVFGVLAVISAVFFIANVAAVMLAWRMVGGRLDWRKAVSATCYFTGVSTILLMVGTLAACGVFKALDPIGYQQVMSNTVTDAGDLWRASVGFRAYLLLIGVAFLVTYAWIFRIWGAYREMMQLSKLRSGIALALFLACTPVLYLLQFSTQYVVEMARTEPAVPADLIGTWQRVDQGEDQGVHWAEKVVYGFAGPEHRWMSTGGYFISDERGSAVGGCLISTSKGEYGTLAVQGTTLVLKPTERTQRTENHCTGQRAETKVDLSSKEYQFQIERKPTGWTLCVSDRFGQMCLTPQHPLPKP